MQFALYSICEASASIPIIHMSHPTHLNTCLLPPTECVHAQMEAKYHAAKVIMVPASDGTGVIAGGSIKSVLELAGVTNVLAKRIGCRSALNNARATVKGLSELRSLNDVARRRGVPMDRLLLPKEK